MLSPKTILGLKLVRLRVAWFLEYLQTKVERFEPLCVPVERCVHQAKMRYELINFGSAGVFVCVAYAHVRAPVGTDAGRPAHAVWCACSNFSASDCNRG